MGFSKKKEKAWSKAKARVGAKAKQKVKKAKQIEARNDFKASKRRAVEATRKPTKGDGEAGGDSREVSSVNALFARLGGDGDDDIDDDDDDESSAGAFHDVGSDDDGPIRGVVEELDDEDEEPGVDAGKRHAEELRAIREKDPEFYKFLVEQDKSLLDFSAPGDDDEEEGPAGEDDDDDGGRGELKGADVGGQDAAAQGKVLTRERLERIQASAKDSFTACKAALNIYHIAVRSIQGKAAEAAQGDEGIDGEEGLDDDGGCKGKKRRSKPKSALAEKKARQRLFMIDDEAIFSDVIEWSVGNLLGLLQHHAGEVRATPAGGGGSSGSGAGRKRNKRHRDAAAAESGPAAGATVVDPTKCKRWLRVRTLAHIFWEETYFLLNQLVAQHMLEYVLRSCSSPEALAWLWPFKNIRAKYLRRCCHLWSTATAYDVRLLSFLFLRNAAAMVLQEADGGGANGASQQLEALIRAALKAFADVASHGYTWRSLSSFRFLENCVIELLRLDDATAYRLGYVCLRQLALILRNACLNVGASAGSGSAGKARAKSKANAGAKKKAGPQQTQVLLAWPFVRSISLWTRAVGSLPALRPLAYPLYMLTMGAAKHKLTSLQFFPFVFHCLDALNRLGAQLEMFVPVSSHVLKVLSLVLQVMDKAHKKKGPKGGDSQTLDSQVRAPDIEISLRFSEAQVSESLVLEAVGSNLCFLLTDHLGLLSQSPAFPEIIAPVVLHLRRHSKHCRSEPLRRQIRTLVEKAEASASAVRARREQLDEAPDPKKFLLFEADTAISKARAEALRRRTGEEKTRVEAESAEDAASARAAGKRKQADRKGDDGPPQFVPEGQSAPGLGMSKHALKRRKAAAVRARKQGATEEPQQESPPAGESAPEPARNKKKRKQQSAKEQARRAGLPTDKDVLEEMDFGSGAED